MVTAKNPILTGFIRIRPSAGQGMIFILLIQALYMHPVCRYSTAGIWHIGSRLEMFLTGKNSFR